MGFNPSPIELTPKELRRQNIYKFFSALCDREVIVESLVEYIVWLSMEFNHRIVFLCERPAELSGRVDGKSKSYRPDLFFRTCDGEESLGEAKKQEDIKEVEPGVWQPARWPIMTALCEQVRLPLKLFVDSDFLPVKTAVANWRDALGHVADEAQRPRHELREQLLKQFEDLPMLSIGELSANLPDWEPTEVQNAALWWVHQGPLSLDWNKAPLGRETVLTLHSGMDWRRV